MDEARPSLAEYLERRERALRLLYWMRITPGACDEYLTKEARARTGKRVRFRSEAAWVASGYLGLCGGLPRIDRTPLPLP